MTSLVLNNRTLIIFFCYWVIMSMIFFFFFLPGNNFYCIFFQHNLDQGPELAKADFLSDNWQINFGYFSLKILHVVAHKYYMLWPTLKQFCNMVALSPLSQALQGIKQSSYKGTYRIHWRLASVTLLWLSSLRVGGDGGGVCWQQLLVSFSRNSSILPVHSEKR